ncbi:hypothetical protein SASPL_105573 [Salvia splendens]|uniref:RING-type E3 ubiquitin transferase n=1 Tax=Salvia splendens TaxID=180675 RepID=A0A8X8YLB6_SALSN|nr:hypothetical protein SASPL_105573 [Salvia splendens]
MCKRYRRIQSPETVSADTENVIEVPSLIYSEGMQLAAAEECAICLSEFKIGERIRVLEKCSHGFHMQCIERWLNSCSSCPICRANSRLPSRAPPPTSSPSPPPHRRRPGRASESDELIETKKQSEHEVKKWWDLIWLGFGFVVGSGIFSITGLETRDTAGPVIVASYAVSGLSALLSVFCYTGFAVEIPVTGGSSSFPRIELGDFIGFIAAGLVQ